MLIFTYSADVANSVINQSKDIINKIPAFIKSPVNSTVIKLVFVFFLITLGCMHLSATITAETKPQTPSRMIDLSAYKKEYKAFTSGTLDMVYTSISNILIFLLNRLLDVLGLVNLLTCNTVLGGFTRYEHLNHDNQPIGKSIFFLMQSILESVIKLLSIIISTYMLILIGDKLPQYISNRYKGNIGLLISIILSLFILLGTSYILTYIIFKVVFMGTNTLNKYNISKFWNNELSYDTSEGFFGEYIKNVELSFSMKGIKDIMVAMFYTLWTVTCRTSRFILNLISLPIYNFKKIFDIIKSMKSLSSVLISIMYIMAKMSTMWHFFHLYKQKRNIMMKKISNLVINSESTGIQEEEKKDDTVISF